MASDPITGLTLQDDRSQDVLDYLGRKSPVALSQQTALPGVQGASPSGAPASPGGTGVAIPGPVQQQQTGTHVASPFGMQHLARNAGGIAQAIGPPLISLAGGQAKDLGINALQPFPGGGMTQEEFDAIANFEGAGAEAQFGGAAGFGADEIAALGGATLGDLLSGYGALSAGYGLGKLGFGLGLHTQTGPSTGNPYEDALIGLLGPGLSEGVAGLVSRLAGPSPAWRNFGQHLGQRLGGESSAIQTLIPWLSQARTRGDVTQAADLFRQLMETGAGVPGYQLGAPTETGAPQIGVIPGAGGTPHEGHILANFGPATQAINQYLAQLYASLPEGPASQPLSYESFAAGWSQPQYDQFMGLAQQIMSLPLDQQQQMVAASGLDPAMQQKLLSYVGDPTNRINAGLSPSYEVNDPLSQFSAQ